MQLSQQALDDLRKVVEYHVGDDVKKFSDQDLNEMGDFLLTTFALSLKVQARKSKLNAQKS